MRVVVTGGAGFIGSQYVRMVLRGDVPAFADAQVVVLDKLTYAANLANLAPVADSPRYRFFQGDICSPADLDQVLPGADVVVNFAAETHVDRSITAGRPADARDDRRGSPTWIPDLAEGLIMLARADAPAGMYHCTNSGATTPSGFARAVGDERGDDADGDAPQLRPADQRAVPAHSVLSGQEWAGAGLAPLPDWRDALHRCFLLARDRRGLS